MGSKASRLTILSVLGTRPEVIQTAALSSAIGSSMREVLVNTGQHYDANMDADQIADTGLATPAYNLAIGESPKPPVELARTKLCSIIRRERPTAVLVRHTPINFREHIQVV